VTVPVLVMGSGGFISDILTEITEVFPGAFQ